MKTKTPETIDGIVHGRISLRKIQLTYAEYRKISGLIHAGGRETAQHIYKFVTPQYDEDAGVVTDYGMNDASRTWANIHLMGLLESAIQDCEFVNAEDAEALDVANVPVWVYFIENSIGAVCQLLWTVVTDEALQKRIWGNAGDSYYESDGHYSGKSRAEVIEEYVAEKRIDVKTAKYLIGRLQDMGNKKINQHIFAEIVQEGK